jgi:hypothetical protein
MIVVHFCQVHNVVTVVAGSLGSLRRLLQGPSALLLLTGPKALGHLSLKPLQQCCMLQLMTADQRNLRTEIRQLYLHLLDNNTQVRGLPSPSVAFVLEALRTFVPHSFQRLRKGSPSIALRLQHVGGQGLELPSVCASPKVQGSQAVHLRSQLSNCCVHDPD